MLLSGLFQQMPDQGSFEAFLRNPSSFSRMFNLSVEVLTMNLILQTFILVP